LELAHREVWFGGVRERSARASVEILRVDEHDYPLHSSHKTKPRQPIAGRRGGLI
jgi:hypothetical protein